MLVFTVYVYQQCQIMRMRKQIADQIAALTKVETLTAEVYRLATLDQLTWSVQPEFPATSTWRRK